MDTSKALEIVILMPVYNDFESAGILIKEIDAHLDRLEVRATVILLDDASTQTPEIVGLDTRLQSIRCVQLVRMRRNLGHQRAIAVGLAWVFDHLKCDAAVVMDADGQDRPEDIPRLIEAYRQSDGQTVIFAERSQRRPEGWVFKLGYQAYKILHAILVGFRVRVGNFSLVPSGSLSRLVAVSELWNHYAAAVFKSRIPYATIKAERGPRSRGTTRMDFPGLLAHGLSAISVFSERVGARLLLFLAAISVVLSGVVVAYSLAKISPSLTVPSWTALALGIAVIMFSQIVVVSCGVVFFIMSNRDTLSFLPIRDYRFFLMETVELYSGGPQIEGTQGGEAEVTARE